MAKPSAQKAQTSLWFYCQNTHRDLIRWSMDFLIGEALTATCDVSANMWMLLTAGKHFTEGVSTVISI